MSGDTFGCNLIASYIPSSSLESSRRDIPVVILLTSFIPVVSENVSCQCD